MLTDTADVPFLHLDATYYELYLYLGICHISIKNSNYATINNVLMRAAVFLTARKSKKLGKLKGVSEDLQGSKDGQTGTSGVGGGYLSSEKELNASAANALVPHGPGVVTPFLPPSICSVLELIEPEEVYSGYDNTQPDTTDHLLSSLNRLAGKQMVRMVKWAKVLPG